MNPIYNFGIGAYALGARLLARRNPKVAKMVKGQKATFDYLRSTLGTDSHCIWIHAASLGEFEQGRPLIEMLRRERPGVKILLTFFSPSGYEVRKNYPQVDAVCYLPFDTPRNARRFLDIVSPSMAIFVKYEFWGNYLNQLKRRGIPTYIISAIFRPSQIFFKPWGGMFRRMLRNFTHLYVQDENSRDLLEGIGVTNVTVAGDTRFDRVTDIMAARPEIPGADKLAVDIAFGSSWGADEEKYIPWLNAHPDVKFILAPHEFNETRIESLVDGIKGNVIRFSQWEKQTGFDPATVRGIVVDSFGKLSALYRFARMAYIGGGYGAGIHNINEAAVYNIPVVFGPNFKKFKEAHDLIRLGGAVTVSDEAQTAATLDRFVFNEEARTIAGDVAGAYIRQNLGATRRIFTDLFPA